MDRLQTISQIKKNIQLMRVRISKLKKTDFWEDDEIREEQENYLSQVRGLNLETLDDRQLGKVSHKVEDNLKRSGSQALNERFTKRVEGLTKYLSDNIDESFGEYNYNKRKHTYTISRGENSYEMTRKEVSEFWSTFRKVYEAGYVQNLKNYDKGLTGVATVFDIYQNKNIKNAKDLIDLIQARYVLEREEEEKRHSAEVLETLAKRRLLRE